VRVSIEIDSNRNYTLEGTPADSPQPDDEILDTQLQLIKAYQEYGIYKVGPIDSIFGGIEPFVARRLRFLRSNKGWRRTGTINPTAS
jgi:hypothetical protein